MTTMADIEARVVAAEYVKRDTKTLCFLTLDNGWSQTGESDCVNVDDYIAELGADVAYADAIDKLWPLLGFLEKEDAYRKTLTATP
jgi:Phage protein (N4 Gp49/phage Sf6 gene 66) family